MMLSLLKSNHLLKNKRNHIFSKNSNLVKNSIILKIKNSDQRIFSSKQKTTKLNNKLSNKIICKFYTTISTNDNINNISSLNIEEDYKNKIWNEYQKIVRNIGISAHIDSGKTTLTERILYYTGRIQQMHEVKGKDSVGATMDFMDLEREKGITIQSAATYCRWNDHNINIIDTPGHVDFTIEVERALRVLDGAILVLCGVSGVQSQTITVDKQMRRYNVPRVVFINKLDRQGADPWKVVKQLREKLKLNASALQIPIGLENNLVGVIDLITQESIFFEGINGNSIKREKVIPQIYEKLFQKKRQELFESLADADDLFAEKFMEGEIPSIQEIKNAIRRATLSHKFIPVLMGSALKNTGVQLLLDSVIDYLPNPMESSNIALDTTKNEEKVFLTSDIKAPFVGLAFKLEEGKFGQLTYMRVYQGSMARGEMIYNVNQNKKIKVPRLVRIHANEMEEVHEVKAGDICAMFGVDCYSGTTFTNGSLKYVMTSMHIPEPVLSLSITTKKKEQSSSFSKALQRFQKEDPTFRVTQDSESNEIIISGMGELHLEIYVERMKREYNVEAITGKPRVAFRETISKVTQFDYLHRKQSGGAGQYARVAGYLEPLPFERVEDKSTEFVNATVGGSIPPHFIPACMKGFEEAIEKGPLTGNPVIGVRMVVNDGAAHSVDSNDLAFRTATIAGFREAIKNSNPIILEPIMKVEISAPAEFQGIIIAGLNKRKGVIENSDVSSDYIIITCEVPLNNMFGYSTDLRSCTQGKGEFTMEYKKHAPVTRDLQEQLINEYKKQQQQERNK